MKAFIIGIIFLMALPVSAGNVAAPAAAQQATPTPAMKDSRKNVPLFHALFNANKHVEVIYQWRPPVQEIEAHPEIDFTQGFPVTKALCDEEFDTPFLYETFSINKNGKRIFIGMFREENFPEQMHFPGVIGAYNIEWKDGIPVRFVLDNNSIQKILEKGRDYKDYKYGFEWFTVSYDKNGLPTLMTGQLLPQYGGQLYSEIYSDYVFNDAGLWVKRNVLQRYGAGSDENVTKNYFKEFRDYWRRSP